jgi:hypothetical protein
MLSPVNKLMIRKIINDSFGLAWHEAECSTTCLIGPICSSIVEKQRDLTNG